MNMKSIEPKIDRYFGMITDTLNGINKKNIAEFIDLLLETYNNNGTIFIFGNGGSGTNASHFCGDFVKGVSYGMDKRFKVICLNDNVPSLTAIANDISYEDIFVEQLKNFVKKEDLVIGISGSGNSVNVIKAIEYANSIGAKTIALCGFDGGRVKKLSTLAIHANINNMEISEDIHLIIIHCVKSIMNGNQKCY